MPLTNIETFSNDVYLSTDDCGFTETGDYDMIPRLISNINKVALASLLTLGAITMLIE